MPGSRVIRIDDDVWAELQRRARPFEDKNPNAVLRRELEVATREGKENISPGGSGLDARADALFRAVGGMIGQKPPIRPVASGQSYSFRGRGGRVRAYIYPQKTRLKVESARRYAEQASITFWNDLRESAWWTEDSVYWYVLDGDDEAFDRVADVIAKLWAT